MILTIQKDFTFIIHALIPYLKSMFSQYILKAV